MSETEMQPTNSAPTHVAPMCHFTPMKYEGSDNGYAGVEYWWECAHCGHTQEIVTETIGA